MTIQSLDTRLLLLVNNGFANQMFDVLMPFLSHQGYLLVTPFLGYLIVLSAVRKDSAGRRYLAAAVWTIVIAVLAVLLGFRAEDLLKLAAERIRPCRSVDGLRLIVSCPQTFSMPSGHAISSFAFASPLFYLTRPYVPFSARLVPLLLASAIVFSRVYLGVHYPADVVVGALVGVLIALVLAHVYLWMAMQWEKMRKRNRGADS